MADEPNALGEYLRARRELVTPEQVGLPVLKSRRVPGLRREEVAMLSGISAEYYLRLEQGRDRNPSTQVLRSIARVLQLDDEGYMVSLASQRRSIPRGARRRETVPPSTARLIDQLPFPAFVEGRYVDVLASNLLATAISPCLRPGRNRLRDVFLDPDNKLYSRTGSQPPKHSLLASADRSAPTSTTPQSSPWSANSPSPAPSFERCGLDTTSARGQAPRSP